MKKIKPTQSIEKEGINAVSTIVNRMGCIWRPTPNDDYGIDGEIEITRDGAPTGKIVKAQCKSGRSYIKNESQTKFDFYAAPDDIEYWMGSNVPVVLVVHDPRIGTTYWKNVQKYIEKHPSTLERPHKIIFYKRKDVFSPNSYFDLCGYVLDETEIVDVMKDRIIEKIFSNLLPVVQLPLNIYGAPTEHTHDSARKALMDSKWRPIHTIREKRMWTFHDVFDEDNPLANICNTDNVQVVKAQDWWLDEDRKRWYVNLLNQALYKRCRKLGLKYDSDHDRYYFAPNEDGTLRRKQFQAFRRKGRRKVAYPYVKDDAIRFWVHHAFKFNFVDFGGNWFLRIQPGYVFTKDGHTPIAAQHVGRLATRRKSREWNIQVLNHLIFWREFLCDGYPTILVDFGGQVLEIEKNYEAGEAWFGIIKDKTRITSLFDFDEPTISIDETGDVGDEEN